MMRLNDNKRSLLGLALLWPLCILHMSLLVNGLKCHCDICTESNHTCITDGYCFASTSLDHDVITHAYRGCFDRNIWFPPEEPIPGDYAYCDDADYCNMNLNLPGTGIIQLCEFV